MSEGKKRLVRAIGRKERREDIHKPKLYQV